MSQIQFATSGNGLWSSLKTTVRITNMRLGYIEEGFAAGGRPKFGELRVYFDLNTWDVVEDGLIYTDPGFKEELDLFLKDQGLNCEDLSYSEQGLQGADYVSFDVGPKFLKTWGEKFGLDWVAVIKDPRGVVAASVQ